MSIKTEASEAMPEAVWSGGVLEAEGRDAGAFLQAQLMNDVSQLGVGDWQWNGWLSPKGRVIALTLLLRRGEQSYWLVLPDYPATRLADDLRRFQFRSKLSLRARDDLFLQPGEDQTGAETGHGAARPDQSSVGTRRAYSIFPRFRRPRAIGTASQAGAWRIWRTGFPACLNRRSRCIRRRCWASTGCTPSA
jgi:folate-binding Fe-S cluster repair protein YgfZ